MGEEFKIVIQYKDAKSIVGVKMADTDPVFFMTNGDIHKVLSEVAADVEEAKTRWQTSKTYPKAIEPVAPATTTPRQTINSTATIAPAKKKETLQPSFDL